MADFVARHLEEGCCQENLRPDIDPSTEHPEAYASDSFELLRADFESLRAGVQIDYFGFCSS